MASQQSRENILNKIRQALAQPSERVVPKPDFSQSIYTSSTEDPSVLFAENFVKHQGEFFYCENNTEFIQSLVLFLEKRNLLEVYVWEKPLQALLAQHGVSVKTDETQFLAAQAGITLCEGLVARTGSILVSSRQTAGRRLSIYPPIHIVVAYTRQLLYDIKDGLQLMEEQYAGAMPSLISLVTGPSRTADIEKTLVLGAHGPKELVLFLIEG